MQPIQPSMFSTTSKALCHFYVLCCEFVNRNVSEDRNTVRDSATLFLKFPSLLSMAASFDGLGTARHHLQVSIEFSEEFQVSLRQQHVGLRCTGAWCSDRRAALCVQPMCG